MPITLQTTRYNVIYIYSRDAHPGLLKIGKTSVAAYDVSELTPNCEKLKLAAYERFKEGITMGVTDLHLHHTEVAHFIGSDQLAHMFDDHDVHELLENSGYKKAKISSELGNADEWFNIDLEVAIKAIAAVKGELTRIDGPRIEMPEHPAIKFRDEQKKAISQTLTHYCFAGEGSKMLWNAKMRFGKTLCALELINQLNVPQVLILTHRPTVRSGWFEDFHLIDFKSPYQYGSKGGKAKYSIYDREADPEGYYKGKDLKTLKEDLAAKKTPYIYFASMQDLRGQEVKTDKNGNVIERVWKENNKEVYETEWDLIIFDEAHEGTQTSLGKEVHESLTFKNAPLKLYLSGTPFNILSQFEEDEIYTWDYNMEQEAKENWPHTHPNEPNPYEGLAQLHIYTYHLGDIFKNHPEYTKSDDDYFNFAEFFRVWTGDENKDGRPMPASASKGDFIHETDVISFLDLLCREEPVSFYPFSNTEFRNALSHTLWMLPGVAQAERLTALINAHRLHTEFGFELVNVAGEGSAIYEADDDGKKIEKKEKDALARVKKVIKEHPKTITLSCGRLTTGVSVPEWTGVFMLSGGYSTSAANYMQTIFRGQTPYKNGAIKTNCYAFDFAPDRTLTVIDDYIKQQPSSKNRPRTPGDGLGRTTTTLKFMPVVAMVGGQEIQYDTNGFITKVNQAYTDHVIANGFKSRKLFRNFATFTPEDHELLKKIGNLLGGGKVSVNSDGTIIMSDSGLTGEKGGKQTGKKSSKKGGEGKTPPKTKGPRDSEAEQRRQSQSVLDYIFVRLPLLLFGAVSDPEALVVNDKLTLDFIDDDSWKEFMPKNFTKGMFLQISHLIALDVLVSSTTKIIQQAKAVDELPIEKRIVEIAHLISKFHFPDKETVLTPWRVVNMHMTDTIGGYDFYDEDHSLLTDKPRLVEQGDITSNIFCNPDAKILEINSKSGIYPLWLAYTLWKLLGHEGMTQEEGWALWKTVLEKNLYIICKTKMAEKITRSVLVGYKTDINPNTVSIENIIERIKKQEEKEKLINEIKTPATYGNLKEKDMLNFDAIVGNPPYQVMDGGTDRGAVPVYQYFVDIAKQFNPNYISMIMPARWYAGGRGLDDFRVAMLSDKRMRSLFDFETSKDLFPTVDIAGGLCYFLWHKSNVGPCQVYNVNSLGVKYAERFLDEFPVFVRSNTSIPILKKVTAQSSQYLNSLVLSINPFGFRTYYRGRNMKEAGDIKILTSEGWSYVGRDEIVKGVENIDKYKIIVGRFVPSNGELNVKPGEGYRVLTTPRILNTDEINTETYIDTAVFDTLDEATNYKNYLCTKFARYLLRQAITSVNVTRECFAFVPIQDFSRSWTDEELYAKYGLSQEEIDLIEAMIKPIE